MNRLTHLRTFLAIYRCRSVTKAARQLNITQPAASGHLQALETRLGRRLFDRRSRGLEPLPAAHDLARSIAPHVDVLETTFAQTRKAGSELAGTVYLGGPAEFLGEMLLPTLGGLPDHGIRVRCRLGIAAELLDAVQKGELDFAIATIRADMPGLGFARLYEEDFRLVGAPQWMDADVASAPVLAYEESLPIIRRYWRAEFGSEPDIRPSLVVPDLRALAAAAAAGLGITVLPGYLCAEMLSEGTLCQLHIPAQPPSNVIYLAWNEFTVRAPRNAFFRQWVMGGAQQWAPPTR